EIVLPQGVAGKQQFNPGSTVLTIDYGAGNPRPAIAKGRWLLDATTVWVDPNNGSTVGLWHANFYRVVSVTDEVDGTMTVELQTPVTRSDNRATAYTGTLMLIPGVAEVFQRPPLTK